ncbi:hypothetical protein GIB67_007317 [Kingdonia uniflora]|uniref:YDG domain-containing protein n=1 Tax=Kingdonia uniflora TaxID=39325 RepID=A0A7J7NX66_9MAGN|nr:hypothetical protein GIB67_007317 [Kingdonia uniflora]
MGGSSRNYGNDIQPVPALNNGGSKDRNRIKEILRKFDEFYREAERKFMDQVGRKRFDLECLKIIKGKGISPYIGREAILGNIRGVEVGDKFQYRVELHIIGLHRPLQNGIDSMRRDNTVLATSIVASGGYVDYAMDNGEVLQYSGRGNLFC